MNILRPDSEVMEFLGKATDLIILNLLCVLCSIPIITIGAAFTAKYYVSMKIAKGEEPSAVKSFFKSFCLNFKQMFYLININYYENLEKFLPKIIQINFEERKINIDFSVLEYFSNKILGKINTQRIYEKKYEKKDIMVSNKSNRAKSTSNKRYEWDNMIIDIKMPFIIKEQFVKSNILNNNVKKFDLNTYFLNILKKSGNNLWSKKILQLLDLKDDNPINNSNLDLVKVKSKDYSNEQNYDDFLKKYNNVKRHSKSLHFKIRKSNI